MVKSVLAALALLPAAPAMAETDVTDLAWLSGAWESGPAPWIEERWDEPRGGMLIGHARFGMDDKALGFEFFRVQAGEDGVLVYHAQPEGRPAVPFRLAKAEGTSVTFENPAHDHPQRISYRVEGDTLTATISKLDGSEAQTFTFRRR